MQTALIEKALQKKLRILLVEDNMADRVLVRASLRKSSSQLYDFIEHEDAEAALEFLAAQAADLPDCMLIDLHMPRLDGFAAIKKINDIWGHTPLPIIVLTGLSGTEAMEMDLAAQALAMGAQDYISKNDLHVGVLNRVIFNAIERFKLINENKIILANLNDREEQYRLATEAANLGTWVFTNDGKFKCTEHCKKLHGLAGSGEDFSHDEFFQLVHDEDRADLNARLKEILDSPETRDFKVDYRIRQADGALRWASAKGRNL